MQERLIQKYQRWDHTGVIKSNHLETYQKKETKLPVQQISDILQQTKHLQEEIGNFFVKRVMVKTGIPPFISEKTVRRFLQ